MAQLVLANILAGSGNVLAGGDNSGNVNKVTIGSNLTLSGGVLSAIGGGSGSVTSVAVSRSGDALSITGSPITTAGTINIGFAGTGAQYIKGDGTLATFPTTISQAQRLITEVYNSTGATLTKGTVVYINGGQGNLPTVTKAQANADNTSAQTYGVVQSDITDMNNGYVVVLGSLTDLDTQAYAVGTQLYLSGTTAGAWTSTKPYAPIHLVYVGIVVRSHPTQGVVEIRIQNGYELDELHDVSAQSPTNGDILQYVAATGLWTKTAGTTTNIAEGTNLYFTNTRARGVLSTNVGSALTYNSTTGRFTLNAATALNDGYLTATDYANFDSKQASLGTGTTSQFLRGDLVWAAPTVPSLDDLTDVVITSPTNGQLLRWQIDHWENWTLPSYVQTTRTLTINGTAYDLSANRTWSVGTITALTGEATASGTGSVAVTLTNSAVIGKVLTGLNVTGGSVAATDSILTAFGKVQNQINGLIGGSIYKGTWNASTNTPALTSSVGTAGWYYIVSVAGSTNLNGITDWQLGDWAIFNGGVWQKVDNTDSVVSVNGFTGAVNLTTDNVSEGSTNLYYTSARARSAVSANPGSALTYNSSTGRFTLEAAATGVSGYITGADYDYWNAKQASLGTGTTSQYLRGDLTWSTPPAPALEDLTDVAITTPSNGQLLRYQAGTWINFTPTYISLTALSATAPLSYNSTTGVFSISQANTSTNGFLSSTDWNTFNNKQPLITAGTTSQYYRGDKTFQTLNTTAVTEGTNLYFTTARVLATALTGYTVGTNTALSATDTILGAFGKVQAQINSKGSGTVTSVSALTIGTTGTDLSSTVATGTTTPVITLNVPTASATNRGALSSADWSTFNGKQNAITLTTTGTSGAATLVGSTLNIPQYTDQYVGTVTSVGLTAPTGFSVSSSPITSSGTIALDFAAGYSLPTNANQADWTTAYSNRITSASAPLSIAANAISIAQATTSTNGYLSSTDWNTFNNKQNALTNPVTGSGATNYVAKWNTASTITNSIIYDNGTQVGINTTNLTSLLDVTKNALGVTVVDNSGLTLKNETDAISGNQQISPAIHFESKGWGTGAATSQTTDWIMYNLPVQGTTPSHNLLFASSVNGAAYTTRATLTSAGALTITGGLSATTGAFSSTLTAVTTATLTRTALTTTSTDGVIIQNTTAALVGTQVQRSPRIRLSGTAWNTGTSASNTTNWIIDNLPAAGNPPTSTLTFAYFDTVNATLTNKFTLTNAGAATFTGAISASNLSGTNTGDQTLSGLGGVPTSRTLTINGTTYDLSADRSWTISTGVSGSGTTNYIPKFTSSSAIGNSIIFDNGTNVGIGTTSPSSKLDVRVALESPATGAVALIAGTSNGINDIFRWYDGTTQLGVFKNNGNVLIGTNTDSGSKLQLTGSTGPSTPIFDIVASGTGSFMRGVRMLNSGMAAGNSLMYAVGQADSNKNMGQFYFYYAGAASTSNRISMGLHSVDDVLNILGTGNVGIGTTSPTFGKLQINSDNQDELALCTATNANQQLVLGYNLAGNYGRIQSVNQGTSYTNLVLQKDGGNVLIGTTTDAGYKLDVSGQVRATAFFESSDKRLKKEIIDNPTINIEGIKPKLYIKDGKEELGYYAQDLQEILPSSVTEGKDGFLSLSYTQVHTAKIASLEKEVAELKELIKTLIK